MVTTYVDQAMQAVRKATGGRGLDRAAALQWHRLLENASGEEAEQIGFMAEALMVATRGMEDRVWLQGLLAGGSQQAHRAESQERSMPMDTTAKRSDAEGLDAEIDWANVGSEAAAMLDLNREAMTRWQGRDDQKSQDA